MDSYQKHGKDIPISAFTNINQPGEKHKQQGSKTTSHQHKSRTPYFLIQRAAVTQQPSCKQKSNTQYGDLQQPVMDFSLLPQNISAEITDNHLRNARQGTQQAFRVEKIRPPSGNHSRYKWASPNSVRSVTAIIFCSESSNPCPKASKME